MRKPALLIAVAALVLGLALTVPSWLLRERDYLSVTPQPPAVEAPSGLRLPAEGRACMNLVALDEHSEEARIWPTPVRGRPVPIEITLSGESGYLARGRSAADYSAGDVVALPVDPPDRDLIATACLKNAGRRAVFLAAVVDRRRSRSSVYVNGAPSDASFALQFAEREPVSILERASESLERMTVLRPAFVSEITLWPLLVLFVAAAPALGLWAYARAVQEDE